MIYNFEYVNDFPVAIIDEFYEKDSCRKILDELKFLSNDNKLLTPEYTGSAYNELNGERIYRKRNLAIGIDNIYINRNISNILTENRKIFTLDVVDRLIEENIFFRYIKNTNLDHTILNYYVDNDYYEDHIDDAVITAISFFYNLPKKFEGGELIIEQKLKIDCNYNRIVIFPSFLNHSVNKVILNDNNQNSRNGRYSITQLMSFSLLPRT
jgi:hypothetical protein